MPLIKCTELEPGYNSSLLEKSLNFSVEEKDYLIIVGENGAGKSTLMKTMLSLIPPYSGSIEFGDGLTATEIGYLPQQTVVQKDFPASVYEVVLSGCQSMLGKRPFYGASEKKLALDNIERMGMSDYIKRSYRELSGGQQQRVLLARALCATHKLLLLDEPVAGLDPNAMTDLYKLIKQLNDEGVTIIMISHDIGVAVQYAKHILHVAAKSYWGSTEDYMKTELYKWFADRKEVEG